MNPRVWIVSKYASLPKYGPGSRLFHLAQEFERQGAQTVLLTSDANHLAQFPRTDARYNDEVVDGVRVRWIRTRKYMNTASVGRVLSWLDFEWGLFRMRRDDLPRPDVVIVSSLSLLTVGYGYFLKRRLGARLVFEVRDIWPLTMVAEGGFRRWHPLVLALGAIERFGYRVADLVVGTMPRLDRHVREVLGRDRPFHCSPLGFSGVPGDGDEPLDEKFVARHFPRGKLVVGYAGSMGISNALEPLMGAIERLSGRSDIHFVLVGDGDLREAYAVRLRGLPNVSFGPRIGKNEVQDFLRRCDVLYLATHDSPVWRFGQSLNKLVDYMMAGRPVIASYSGHRSMLDEAEAGVFLPAGDTEALVRGIEQVAALSREERVAMGARGRAWILQHRSYAVLAAEYLRALASLGPRRT